MAASCTLSIPSGARCVFPKGARGAGQLLRPQEATAALPGRLQAAPGFWEEAACAHGVLRVCAEGEARLRSPASQHQLLLGWPVPNSGVNVHREQSTGTVKNGSQGAHKGSQHD